MTSTDLRARPYRLSLATCLLLSSLSLAACATGDDGVDSRGGDDEDESSSSGEETGDAASEPVEAEDIRSLLVTHCVKCHGPGAGAKGGIEDITDLERLISEGLILPNKPDESPLFRRISDPSNPMPPLSETSRPTPEDIASVQEWISTGALTGEDACSNPVIPISGAFDSMFKSMRDDILDLDEEDRGTTRYLTLTHLHNAGMCQRELDLYRDGLAKAVNSLSREPVLVRPVPIDEAKTIYRIDLRDYGWDSNENFPETGDDVWDAIVEVNPFAVQFKGNAADILREQSGADVPFQTADSFIQLATGGLLDGVDENLALYTRILDVPNNITDLQLQVTGKDAQSEIANDRAFRVILEDSGVSQWNRAYDRFSGANNGQYLYVSHDFDNAGGDADLFSNPIDFVAAGGEVIFTLPNGLQGYMLADAAGKEILEGPTDVVGDPGQKDGVVRVGISCMACHNNGIISKRDEFYDFYNGKGASNKNLFSAADHDLIEKLFADPDASLNKQDVDALRFRTALTEMGINLENPEPIINTSWQFTDSLNMTRVAAELGTDEQSLLLDLRRLQDNVSISYGQLLTGNLSRDTFSGTYKAALCLLLKNSEEEPDEPECAEFEDDSEDTDTDDTDGTDGTDGTDTDDKDTDPTGG
jgi:mono/diheme cytochrome c family protein